MAMPIRGGIKSYMWVSMVGTIAKMFGFTWTYPGTFFKAYIWGNKAGTIAKSVWIHMDISRDIF